MSRFVVEILIENVGAYSDYELASCISDFVQEKLTDEIKVLGFGYKEEK